MRLLVAVLIVAGLAVLIHFWRRFRFRVLLRQLDTLAASDLGGYCDLIRRDRGPSPELLGALIERYWEISYPLPARRVISAWLLGPSLEKVALRPDDPFAPEAWIAALHHRHDENHMHAGVVVRVRSGLSEAELRALWSRALKSADPWGLPPELDVHEEHP